MSYLQNLTPNFSTIPSNNFYEYDTKKPFNGADISQGYDIDKQTISVNGKEFGDYDEFKLAHLSTDSYIPRHTNGLYNKKIIDGEPVYQLQSTLIDSPDTINNMINVSNGRVPDVDVVPKKTQVVDIPMKYDNQETSIKGIIEQNAVNDIFFSDLNVKVIQDAIRYVVYTKTKKVIAEYIKFFVSNFIF